MSKGIEIFTDENEKFVHLAKTSTETMKNVSNKACEYIKSRATVSTSSVLAYHHDNIDKIESNLTKASMSVKKMYQDMIKTPIIAKTVIQINSNKEIREYYIGYGSITGINEVVISRDAPMGRLRSLPVGDEYFFGEDVFGSSKDDGKSFTVVQQSKFYSPKINKDDKWDTPRTEYTDVKNTSIVTLKSLLNFLNQYEYNEDINICENGQDDEFDFILNQIEYEEKEKDQIIAGRLHETVSSFNFRVEHTLDKEQDEIARLPLNYSLILLGPAGSGKTTTLIHRVRQKLNREYLSDTEKKIISEIDDAHRPYEDNWIMFSPTELLSLQLQKAFNEDGVPATNNNIMTWQVHTNHLGREFEILRRTNKSGMIYDSTVDHLISVNSRLDIYDNFKKWIIDKYIENSTESISIISSFDIDENLFNLLGDIENAKSKFLGKGDIISYVLNLVELRSYIEKSINDIRNEINKISENSLRKLGSNVRSFSSFLQEHRKNSNDDIDEHDISDELLSGEDTNYIKKVYKQAITQYALTHILKNNKKMSQFSKEIIEWLGDELLPGTEEVIRLGKLSLQLRAFSAFSNPIKSFFKNINTLYKEFRDFHKTRGIWYKKEISNNVIDSTELDIILLCHLQMMNLFLNRSNVWKNLDSDSSYSYLSARCKEYYHQVLVDEAPDFSPIQLRCMRLLTHPKVNSFFACGDFYQRTNVIGTSSYEELKKFFDGSLLKREVDISYRQNKILFDFSRKVLRIVNSSSDSTNDKCAGFANEGYAPVLGEHLDDIKTSLATWIADRVCEIEKELDNEMPSIGILVPEESYVVPVAKSLEKALLGRTSVRIEACQYGERVGTESAIRVFDIQHIKGLEFEAAIFVAFDRMAELYPTLSGNFLYVGATRAANFLGVTCENVLPLSLKDLRDSFATKWADI